MRTRYKILLLLLILLLPFNTLAKENYIGEGEVSNGAPVENDPNMVVNGEEPVSENNEVLTDTAVLEEPVTTTENVTTDPEVTTDLDTTASNTTTEDNTSTLTLTESEETDSSVPDPVDKPTTNLHWFFLIFAWTIITVVFGLILYVFFRLFLVYSSVIEKLDDNAESIIVVD